MPSTVTAVTCAEVTADGARVTVRLVDLAADDEATARASRVLTPAELARARRGTPAVHRRRVLLRAALRTALAAELGTAPGAVPVHTAPSGRPVVGVPGLDVSCSASGVLGLVAVCSGRRIGVDVERVTLWTPDVLEEGWLDPVEQRTLVALPPAARAVAATRAWTQKEAVLKARGTGLLEDPRGTVTSIGRTAGTVAGWSVRDVPVPDTWVASLAVAPDEEGSR